jgi:hypothetical protein
MGGFIDVTVDSKSRDPPRGSRPAETAIREGCASINTLELVTRDEIERLDDQRQVTDLIKIPEPEKRRTIEQQYPEESHNLRRSAPTRSYMSPVKKPAMNTLTPELS